MNKFKRATLSMGNRIIALAALLAIAIVVGGCSDQQAPPADLQSQANSANPESQGPFALVARVDTSDLPANLPSEAKVFVFVKAAGERMPLMVEAYGLNELPPSIEFSSPDPAQDLLVVARVSLSGKVDKSASDFESVARGSFAHPSQEVTLSFAEGTATNATTTESSAPNSPAGKSVTVNLSMAIPAKELTEFTNASRVYVIAKAPGSPVPLAVKAFAIDEVPDQLVLTDKDAMMPSRSLSTATSIELSARASRSGNVSRASGDWEGIGQQSDPKAPNDYDVRIDQRIP